MAKRKTKTKVDEVPAAEDGIVVTDETKVDEVPAAEDGVVVTDETKVDETPVAEEGIVIANKKHKKHKLGGQFVV